MRQDIAAISKQITHPPIAAAQSRQALRLPADGHAQDVPTQAVELFQQAGVIDLHPSRSAPQQGKLRRTDAPTVGVAAGEPGAQGLRRLARAQFKQIRRARQLWLEPQLLGFVHQARGVAAVGQQQGQQIIATLAPPLLFGLLVALADQHFSGHAHQFGIGA